jgi:hypothetical protein
MTFLELCQRLRIEAGISGTGPISVVGQTGEYEKVVKWILTAYEDIQNMHATWKFLQDDFSFLTADGAQNYTLAAADLTDLATWKHDEETDLTIYSSVSDEQYLIYVPWSTFKAAYMFGNNRTAKGRPTIATIKPDNSMSLWMIPDGIYTVTGEYFKKAQTLSANTDVPLIPTQYQMIIVWRALTYYGAFAAAGEKFMQGQNEYRRILKEMEKHQLPQITWGEPLA